MTQRIIASFLIIVIAFVTFMSWSASNGSKQTNALEVRRVSPTDANLRGQPLEPVTINLELTNRSSEIIELAPLKLSCSCQLEQAPDRLIPPRGNTHVTLKLSYPPARQKVVPVDFFTPSGVELAKTEIVLDSDRKVPYFEHCPKLIKTQLIEGVSKGIWTASAATVEETDSLPFVADCRVGSGDDLITVTMTHTEHSHPGHPECQRTYRLKFDLLSAGWNRLQTNDIVQGDIVLQLRDGTEHFIPWVVRSEAPLSIFHTRVSDRREVRGVRRGGAVGSVLLKCLPEGSGSLSQSHFENNEKIVALINDKGEQVEGIQAEFRSDSGAIVKSITPITK